VLICEICGVYIYTMIQIKTANISDAELIADISRETFYDTYAAYNTKEDMDKFMSEQFTKEQLMAQVHDPEHLFLLAYENNEPAGYVFLEAGSPTELPVTNALEIKRLYARTSFIGKGIGKALMQSAINHAKKRKQRNDLAHCMETKFTCYSILHFFWIYKNC